MPEAVITGFEILNDDGTTLGGFWNVRDSEEDAESLRQKLHALPEGSYWLIAVRATGCTLRNVLVDDRRTTYVPMQKTRYPAVRLSQTARDILYSTRARRLKALRVPERVIATYLAKT